MKPIGYLIRYDELALKGKNRPEFERQLMRNIRHHCKTVIPERLWGRILIKCETQAEIEKKISHVMGISSFSPVVRTESRWEDMVSAAKILVAAHLSETSLNRVTFCVRANRADKQFPLASPEINQQLGGDLLNSFSRLKVDLTNPSLTVELDIREEGTFMTLKRMPGLGGLPVGSSAKVLALLSGGIDSPVAAWMMMKRGCPVDFIHFDSYPFTSLKSREKVGDLFHTLKDYNPQGRLILIPFAKIQEDLSKKSPSKYRTILFRRMMGRISERVGEVLHARGLVTGESVGQVASQTVENMSVIRQATRVMVLSPLMGMNKQETVTLAKKIGTYDISIRPYEDCCTLFQSEEPSTRAKLGEILEIESQFPLESWCNDALNHREEIP